MRVLLLLISAFSFVHAMDVDHAPVLSKKKRARSDSTEINTPTSSNSSSVSSNYVVLTDEQVKLSKWVMHKMAEQNQVIEELSNLTYPAGIAFSMRKREKKLILADAKDVAENRDVLEQNTLRQLANWAALQHRGMSMSELPGCDDIQKKEVLQQVQNDIARLFQINDHVVRCCKETPEPAQPAAKKQKRAKGDQ